MGSAEERLHKNQISTKEYIDPFTGTEKSKVKTNSAC